VSIEFIVGIEITEDEVNELETYYDLWLPLYREGCGELWVAPFGNAWVVGRTIRETTKSLLDITGFEYDCCIESVEDTIHKFNIKGAFPFLDRPVRCYVGINPY
jgi:hypothetical protein